MWAKIVNASTNSAIQTAISTMRQANATFTGTLRDAGIEGIFKGMGKGIMFEGNGQGSKEFGQRFGKNEMPTRQQNGRGGRK